ncbi:hypothetical protein Anas_06298, partial [Armadillidium nasatum]
MKFSPSNSFNFQNKSWRKSKTFFKFIVCVLIGGWLILKVLAPRTGGENSTENVNDSIFSEGISDDYLDNTNILVAKIARKNYPIFHYEDAKRIMIL